MRCFESIILNWIFTHKMLNGVYTDPMLICEIGFDDILEDVPQHSLSYAMIKRLKGQVYMLSGTREMVARGTTVKCESKAHPWIETYQSYLGSKGRAKESVYNERYILEGFLKWLPSLRKFEGVEMADINLFRLRHEDVRTYLNALRRRVNSGEIAKTTASTQSWHAFGFLRFCHERYGIEDVVRNLHGLDAGDTIDWWIPSQKQVQDFFDVIMHYTQNPTQYTILFGCMYLLGMRPGESLGLQWERIDLSDMTLEFVAKGGDLHKMPLVEPLHSLFVEMRQLVNQGAKYVFEKPSGKMMSSTDMQIAFRVFAHIAGWPSYVWPRIFRHAFCTHLLIETRNYLLVNRLARHKKLSITERYVHFVEHQYQDAAGSIQNALTIPFIGGDSNGNSSSQTRR